MGQGSGVGDSKILNGSESSILTRLVKNVCVCMCMFTYSSSAISRLGRPAGALTLSFISSSFSSAAPSSTGWSLSVGEALKGRDKEG